MFLLLRFRSVEPCAVELRHPDPLLRHGRRLCNRRLQVRPLLFSGAAGGLGGFPLVWLSAGEEASIRVALQVGVVKNFNF